MSTDENLHAGHRKRMREEFLAKGFDEFTPTHKILELLLFHCIPRKDTNELAHQLIKKYKSLSGVLDAPIEELVEFEGLSYSNAILLKLIIPISRVYGIEKKRNIRVFNNISEVGEYMVDMYFGLTIEKVALLGLDGFGKKIFFEFVSEGDISEVGIPMRGIVKRVIESGATCVVIAHNHPKSTALPSSADIGVTKEVAEVLGSLGVSLLDHIIVSANDYVSLRQSGEYNYIFTKLQTPQE